MEDIEKELEEKSIERTEIVAPSVETVVETVVETAVETAVEDVVAVKPKKVKKPRSEKQIAAFERAKQKRAENIALKKQQKEEYKNLYEEAKADRDKFRDDAQKFYSIEQSRKERLLESFPENLREKMSKLDSETLEQMKTEFTNKVPQVDNSGGGVSGGKSLEWSKLAPSERKKHFADIMRKK